MREYLLHKSKDTFTITKGLRPICALDRASIQEKPAQIPEDAKQIPFLFILGLYKYEIAPENIAYYLVLVTEDEKCGFFNVCRVKKYKIIPISNREGKKGTKKFHQLLDKGLNQCSMYYSDDYNLTLTFLQRRDQQSRPLFTWNYEAIECLKDKWPNAKFYKEVIGGHFIMKEPFVLISRKSNKNGGCHTWNRGADINGFAANFIENEEIMITNNINDIDTISAISHIEIGGSCPIFWTQYPTMQLSRHFHFGPQEQCERRFDLHFENLSTIYNDTTNQKEKIDDSNNLDNLDLSYTNKSSGENPFIIVSLLSQQGKEKELNRIYSDLAQKKKIKFINIDFNELMKTEGELSKKISKLVKYFDVSIRQAGKITKTQTKFIRVNCSSCLDRTSVFMEILFQNIFLKKYFFKENSETSDEKNLEILEKNIQTHKKIWLERSNAISKEYAITRGMKTYLITDDYQTITGKFVDYAIQAHRFFNSIFCEGRYQDAYNAVLQERNFTKFESAEFLQNLFLFLHLILLFIYLCLFEGHGLAAQTWKEKIKKIVNHPHIPDLRDADEFDFSDFRNIENDK